MPNKKEIYIFVIDDYRDNLKRPNNFKVVFTRRETNDNAHALIMASILYGYHSDFHHPSKFIW